MQIKKYFLFFIKHLSLYFIVNILGAAFFGLCSTLMYSSGNVFYLLKDFIEGTVIFLFYGSILNLIPYLILLSIIKSNQEKTIKQYITAGILCPVMFNVPLTFVFFGLNLIFLPVLCPIGAICGALYGYLDKKFQL